MLKVIGNNSFGERLHGLARGHQLIEHFSAFILAFNHRCDALELSCDLAETDLQGAAVGLGVGWAM